MNIKNRLKVVYRGNVQGVGFRFAVRHLAETYDICGIVRNEPDGSVLVVAEGTRGCLDSFLAAVETSHVAGYIREKTVEEEPYLGEFSRFRVDY